MAFAFPRWTNRLRALVLVLALVVPVYAVLLVGYGGSTQTKDERYQPIQPLAYSHAMHAGDLGIDCRYCHVTVELAAMAAVPPTRTCINCHSMQQGIRVHLENNSPNPKLVLLEEAFYGSQDQPAGLPIPWVRVHDLAQYVYFNHSAHVRRGVGCVHCHGRIDRMEIVYQAKPLSMSWCLECHRNPGPNLRPRDVAPTDMTWTPPPGALGERMARDLLKEYNIRDVEYLTSCSTCHR